MIVLRSETVFRRRRLAALTETQQNELLTSFLALSREIGSLDGRPRLLRFSFSDVAETIAGSSIRSVAPLCPTYLCGMCRWPSWVYARVPGANSARRAQKHGCLSGIAWTVLTTAFPSRLKRFPAG